MKSLIIIFLYASILSGFAQQAVVMDPNAITVPRFANAAAVTTAIPTPVQGMFIYRNDTQSFWFYNGAWTNLAPSVSDTEVSSGTNSSNTTSTGNVGIGNSDPAFLLDISKRMRIRSESASIGAGIWFNNNDNTALNTFFGNDISNNLQVFSLSGNRTIAAFNPTTGGFRVEGPSASSPLSKSLSIGGYGKIEVDAPGVDGGRFSLLENGNVGIGVANPTTAKLVIAGGSEGIDLSSGDSYANMRVIRNSLSTIDKDMYVGFGSGVNSSLHLFSNNNETTTIRNGKVGIGEPNPGFLLNFPSTLGDKISLYGTSGAHYGLGVNGGTFLIHAGVATDDIAFGTGSYSAFAERFRFKGNGSLGLGASANVGASGQVLTSNGAGQPASWDRPVSYGFTSPGYFNIIDLTGTNYVAIPNTNTVVTVSKPHLMVLNFKVETFKFCSIGECPTQWVFRVKLNGNYIEDYNVSANSYGGGVDYDSKTLGPTLLNLPAGTHIISFEARNEFNDPTIHSFVPVYSLLPN